ncbi:MAG: adenylate/guanylate cyclase domain-containing protein [Caldilineae bacterium]|nr:adenylate/guanylate cyclase domain-containing protein [Anaerolineae bacterium]MCB0201475.1 adenylate/guanylate cyclase domain-containing protein [Anaerolineae bacterium]MCB0206073.1 adenylate/guanylate cyclase domain-containing protein [Anaerolineae bacterium]MCB9155412.1 adenylate/guanylate cyclase domain-containing protein [Caldilineae bacterium]
MNVLTSFAYDPSDTQEIRIEKFAALLVAGSCCLAGLVWSAMYIVVFGWGVTAALPLVFVVVVGAALLVSHLRRNHYYAVYAQIICIIGVTMLIQWSIGGVAASGFVMVWAFLGPLTALMFLSLRQSIVWFAVFMGTLTITVALNNFFALRSQPVPEGTMLFFFYMNLSFASIVVFLFAGYFVSNALREREKANVLLLNVLPKEIAPRLKANNQTIADHYDSASVLFADIVGSTPLFAELEPAEAVDWLNEVFSMFDRLAEKYGVEKIRTIGDNYMVASGVPVSRPDHAQALAQLALDMIDGLRQLPARNGRRMEFRVGINSGPMVAGVIGKTKFHYDLWGDTVNIASRMESHGEVGRVQLTEATYRMLRDDFVCVPRGEIAVKGKGAMPTWFLVGRKASTQAQPA